MKQANATCLALDAGRCLLLDGSAIVDAADEAGIQRSQTAEVCITRSMWS